MSSVFSVALLNRSQFILLSGILVDVALQVNKTIDEVFLHVDDELESRMEIADDELESESVEAPEEAQKAEARSLIHGSVGGSKFKTVAAGLRDLADKLERLEPEARASGKSEKDVLMAKFSEFMAEVLHPTLLERLDEVFKEEVRPVVFEDSRDFLIDLEESQDFLVD